MSGIKPDVSFKPISVIVEITVEQVGDSQVDRGVADALRRYGRREGRRVEVEISSSSAGPEGAETTYEVTITAIMKGIGDPEVHFADLRRGLEAYFISYGKEGVNLKL